MRASHTLQRGKWRTDDDSHDVGAVDKASSWELKSLVRSGDNVEVVGRVAEAGAEEVAVEPG